MLVPLGTSNMLRVKCWFPPFGAECPITRTSTTTEMTRISATVRPSIDEQGAWCRDGRA